MQGDFFFFFLVGGGGGGGGAGGGLLISADIFVGYGTEITDIVLVWLIYHILFRGMY